MRHSTFDIIFGIGMYPYKSNIRPVNLFRSYFVAGKLLHLITLIELLAIALLIPLISRIETGGAMLLWGLKYYAIIFLSSLPVFSQLDARSRFQNYKQIKDQIFFYGYDERIFRPVLKSRCQRDAAWLSAEELGHGDECRKYFRNHGYRWYHIFPDFVFSRPQFLLTAYFWRTTFFSRTYNPKVDYYHMLRAGQASLKYTETNATAN
ncbi:MAG TPA: hypothetical protein VK994_02945 [Bacteroidales bacterium]|nr:hypothetical protein [Bacteroidales bacterium]